MAMFADAMSNFDLHMRNINTNSIIYYEIINGHRINCQKRSFLTDINGRPILTEITNYSQASCFLDSFWHSILRTSTLTWVLDRSLSHSHFASRRASVLYHAFANQNVLLLINFFKVFRGLHDPME